MEPSHHTLHQNAPGDAVAAQPQGRRCHPTTAICSGHVPTRPWKPAAWPEGHQWVAGWRGASTLRSPCHPAVHSLPAAPTRSHAGVTHPQGMMGAGINPRQLLKQMLIKHWVYNNNKSGQLLLSITILCSLPCPARAAPGARPRARPLPPPWRGMPSETWPAGPGGGTAGAGGLGDTARLAAPQLSSCPHGKPARPDCAWHFNAQGLRSQPFFWEKQLQHLQSWKAKRQRIKTVLISKRDSA